MKIRLSLLILPWALVLSALPVHGVTITVDTMDGGGQVGGFFGPYDPGVDMPPIGYPPILPPDNDPTFQNYFTGRSTLGPLTIADTTPERRPFFIFDMAGILAMIPSGHTIVSVSMELELTTGGSAVLANFSGGMEIVEFTGTPHTADEILDTSASAISPDIIWSTFGTSAPYGSFGIDGTPPPMAAPPSADGTIAMPVGLYDIDLPGAIPDVETAILGGDFFVVTGRLATFDPDVIGPGAPPAVDPYEYVFGLSDVVPMGGGMPLVGPPVLTIVTEIPEPSALAFLGLAAALVFCRGRRRS